MRWALSIGGFFGLFVTATMLPVTVGLAIGRGGEAYAFAEDVVPIWARYSALSAGGIGVLVVGALCALLLVSGRWPTRVLAGLAATWFIYAKWAFTVDKYWQNRMANTGDLTPYFVFVAISAAVLLTVSVLAFIESARLGRPVPPPDGA
jgi:hypothetical protein